MTEPFVTNFKAAEDKSLKVMEIIFLTGATAFAADMLLNRKRKKRENESGVETRCPRDRLLATSRRYHLSFFWCGHAFEGTFWEFLGWRMQFLIFNLQGQVCFGEVKLL